jgi:RNA polymerase sigma factor (sigma-70 family)
MDNGKNSLMIVFSKVNAFFMNGSHSFCHTDQINRKRFTFSVFAIYICIQMFFNTSHDKKLIKQLWSDRRPLMQWVLKNSGTREDAEDIIQEAIIVYMELTHRPDFKLAAKPGTILFSIGRNLWLYQLRKEKRMIRTGLQEMEEIQGIDEWEAMQEKEDKLRMMEHVLKDMGAKCLQLLDMFYFLKLDMTEIAVKLGFRNDKVAKAMKYKCLEQARQMIKHSTDEGH